jgi:hypothetical protein
MSWRRWGTTANLTLAIYARQMNRRDGEPERLKALMEGRDWAAANYPRVMSPEVHMLSRGE